MGRETSAKDLVAADEFQNRPAHRGKVEGTDEADIIDSDIDGRLRIELLD